MKIGIRLHDLAKDTPENAVKKAKEAGFDYIQLVFKKSFILLISKLKLLHTSNAAIIFS